MRKFNSIEYNQMCAEFLGLKKGFWIHVNKKFGTLTDKDKQWCDMDGNTFLGTYVYYDKDLKFDSDWNWIMEVKGKIESIQDPKVQIELTPYWLVIGCNTAKIEVHPQYYIVNSDELEDMPDFFSADTTKEALIQAIWNFLNWYNNGLNKKTTKDK